MNTVLKDHETRRKPRMRPNPIGLCLVYMVLFGVGFVLTVGKYDFSATKGRADIVMVILSVSLAWIVLISAYRAYRIHRADTLWWLLVGFGSIGGGAALYGSMQTQLAKKTATVGSASWHAAGLTFFGLALLTGAFYAFKSQRKDSA